MFAVLLAATLFVVPSGMRPSPPVSGAVIQRFVAPACPRCAGHRGVTIASTKGQAVRAVLPGVITFVGEVAGNTYVVELVAPGVKVTYGWMDIAEGLVAGDAVEQGQSLGVAGVKTYLGVRRGGVYVEPLRYLGLGWARLRGHGGVVVGLAGSAR
jgi:murein DD-endopeptidase MepM/ murein hydrolase activator NlpD